MLYCRESGRRQSGGRIAARSFRPRGDCARLRRVEGVTANMGMVGNLHLERGIALKVEGNYDAALEELSLALTQEPNNSAVHHQMGLVYGFTGSFDESLEQLKKAVDLDGASVQARNDLALTYSMLGMYEEAKAEFQEVLRRDPVNEIAQKNLIFF